MTRLPDDQPVLIVPGIGNSGPRHWQSLWQGRHSTWRRVMQRDWDRPSRDEWVDALHRSIARCAVPPVLVAHSMGCLTVAHWAGVHALPLRVAFLVAVPDPSGPQFPPEAVGFSPLTLQPMTWPTLVVTSSNDPYGSVAFASVCAAGWGGEIVDVGSAGHINTESGHGEWPEGYALLLRFLASIPRQTAP